MVYDNIIVDVSNLFYRLKKNSKTSIDIIKKINNYIGELQANIHPDGSFYFLFDPISYSDLNEAKNFHYPLNERKKILPDYKANRVYSELFLETIELFRKYYLYRGEKFKLIYSDEYEADDFIEPLLKRLQEKSIALITTDYDFARYISDNPVIHMVNKGIDQPFTKDEFEKLFQFKPTNASVIMYKSLFGDKSDNILGALYLKKVKFNTNIKMLCRNYLQEVSDNNMTIDDAVQQLKNATIYSVTNKKENKTAFDELFLVLSIVNLKISILDKIYSNVNIIKSMLADKDIEPYIHCNPENATINDVIHKSIYGIPFRSSFGKVI